MSGKGRREKRREGEEASGCVFPIIAMGIGKETRLICLMNYASLPHAALPAPKPLSFGMLESSHLPALKALVQRGPGKPLAGSLRPFNRVLQGSL